MIYKTVKQFNRVVPTWENNELKTNTHIEVIVQETWRLFNIIPIYRRENIFKTIP